MGDKIFIPNQYMIKGFEELQKEYLGEVMSSDQYKGFCKLNGKCDEYFSEPDPSDKSNMCDYANIAAIDGNRGDISFGDLLVHHVRTDSTYKRFKMQISNADPITLDEQLVQAVEENYGVCSEDGMNAVETFIAAVAEGKLDEKEADRIADSMDELEEEKIAELIGIISSETSLDEKKKAILKLGGCGKAAVPVLKSMLADIYPAKQPCTSEGAELKESKWDLEESLGYAIRDAFIMLIEKGGGEAVVEAAPELLNAAEAGWNCYSLGKVLPYIEDAELKERAVSFFKYEIERNPVLSDTLADFLRCADGDCYTPENYCREQKAEEEEKKAEEQKEKEHEEKMKKVISFEYFLIGMSLNLGGGYLNTASADLGGFSYDAMVDLGLYFDNWGDVDTYGLNLEIGLGGTTYGGGNTLGSFIAGVTHFGYPNCHGEPCSGYRIGAGYKMAFDKQIEGNAVYGELLYSLSWLDGWHRHMPHTWLGIGPSVEYYPDSGDWGIGGKVKIGFDSREWF